jgi:hypothetical protein
MTRFMCSIDAEFYADHEYERDIVFRARNFVSLHENCDANFDTMYDFCRYTVLSRFEQRY